MFIDSGIYLSSLHVVSATWLNTSGEVNSHSLQPIGNIGHVL